MVQQKHDAKRQLPTVKTPSWKVLTVNTNGMRDPTRRAKILQWLITSTWDVALITDTRARSAAEGRSWLQAPGHAATMWNSAWAPMGTDRHAGGVAIITRGETPTLL